MGNKKYSQEEIDIFWRGFLKETSRDETTKYLDVFHFELTEKWANELLRLVLIGQKKATASSLWAYEIEGDRVHKVGDLGYEFKNNMPVIFEDFEVVYQV